MLLDACQAAHTDTWLLPLALLLEDATCLAGASTYPLTADIVVALFHWP